MRARILPVLFVVVAALAAGCSDDQLRSIVEEPQFFEQPDALGPTLWVDQFQQRTVPQSDILFVVDNSCSMEDEQVRLAENFDAFIQSFVDSTLDYHIGVVEGDLDSGSPQSWGILREYQGARWIDPDTPNKVDAFNAMAQVGADGSGACEMGLSASHAALTYQATIGAPNDGFYREDALLSIIILSDEPDQSGSANPFGGCGGVGPDEYIPWLLFDIKGFSGADEVFFTGIVGDRPNGCSAGADGGADVGTGYWDVIDEVDGNFFSICDPEWAPFLTELGLEAAGLKKTFYLRRVPKEGTLVVTLDGIEAPLDTWSYDRVTNAITFPVEYIPEELVVVEASYELTEDVGSQPPVE